MKKVTRLKDLAEMLGVSITTVSKALNDHPDISEKRKKEIVAFAKEMNYVPNQVARSFRQNKTKLIAIVVSDNSNPLYAQMIHNMEKSFSKIGYYCVVMNSFADSKKEHALIRQLCGLNVAGIILNPVDSTGKSREILRQNGIPYILLNGYFQKEEDEYVTLDNYKSGFMATDYLCEYGNQDIYLLTFSESSPVVLDRVAGYRDALSKNKIPFHKDHVFFDCNDQESGYHIVKTLLESKTPPFSIVCSSDYTAIGAICAIQERGYRIPHDISLCGSDNIEYLSYLKPKMTTISFSKKEMSQICVDKLLHLIEQNESGEDIFSEETSSKEEDTNEKRIIIKPNLIIRETS